MRPRPTYAPPSWVAFCVPGLSLNRVHLPRPCERVEVRWCTAPMSRQVGNWTVTHDGVESGVEKMPKGPACDTGCGCEIRRRGVITGQAISKRHEGIEVVEVGVVHGRPLLFFALMMV